MTVGDAVELTAREGELECGVTGVVIGVFSHSSGDLVVVRFGKATRVVHAASLKSIRREAVPTDTV